MPPEVRAATLRDEAAVRDEGEIFHVERRHASAVEGYRTPRRFARMRRRSPVY
jgi:RNA:NAD 2'-phosphotransferase (TPT1/KptA family)